MPKYLLEIGTEELPAQYLPEAQAQLAESMRLELTGNHLEFADIASMSTPRRLILIVDQVTAMQQTVEKTVKGPPVKSSFDKDGKPLPSALGFANKHNLNVNQLVTEEVSGVEYLVAHLKIAGIKAEQLLSEIVPNVIKKLAGERMMRWGSQELKFSRPIRWIVSLLNDQIVPFEFAQIKAGRTSIGHRTLSAGPIEIKHVDQYLDLMRANGVIADPIERRKLIEEQLTDLTNSVGGKARHTHESLLQEVVNLTEYPQAILGKFASEYLDLPDLLIETIMIHHQRYFPIEKASQSGKNGNSELGGNLLPHFVSISNNTSADSFEKTRLGNERVLKARLADGRFFFFDDQKIPLSKKREALAQLTFQEGLGSYEAKTLRLHKAAKQVATELKFDQQTTEQFKRAIDLCKADLVSNLVRELPELQGYVGSWYAVKEKEAPAVVAAIASHYSPRSTEGQLPTDLLGRLISLLDKLDSVAGAIIMGRKPSSSGDPFAVRRQTQGLIDIGLALDKPLNISALANFFTEELCKENRLAKANPGSSLNELLEFLKQRLYARLEERFNHHMVEAVTAVCDPLENLPDIKARLSALKKFVEEEHNEDILRAGVRVANIVNADEASELKRSQFSEPAEIKLFESYLDVDKQLAQILEVGCDYASRLEKLKHHVEPLVDLFDKLMVNDENPEKRRVRRSLLANIDKQFRYVADFSKLQPLLN